MTEKEIDELGSEIVKVLKQAYTASFSPQSLEQASILLQAAEISGQVILFADYLKSERDAPWMYQELPSILLAAFIKGFTTGIAYHQYFDDNPIVASGFKKWKDEKATASDKNNSFEQFMVDLHKEK